MKTVDIAVIGAGIIGLSVGRQLVMANPGLSVLVLDKETEVAEHASGRNSGVMHSGFYYSPDSLKAKLTRRGNILMHEFCDSRGVPIRRSGKVVVTKSERELGTLQELASRAKANGVPVEMVDEARLHEIEPLARTTQQALWSPTTSVANPTLVTQEMAKDFVERGGELSLGTRVDSVRGREIHTSEGIITAGHVINCAGLYADVFAHDSGLNDDYVMMPFKGLYWYAPTLKGTLRTHIYPVPDIKNPFLGVHFTVTVDGDVKVGPTAIPAFWREDYGRLSNFSGSEAAKIVYRYPRFLTSRHHNIPRLLRSEVPKYNRRFLVSRAKALAPTIPGSAFTKRGRSGMRAQLLNKRTGALEMDFVLRGNEDSTHVLNSVSPAWTSAIAVAEYVLDDLTARKVL